MGDEQNFPAYRVLSTRAIVWAAMGLMVVGVGLAVWLLLAYGGGTDADKARLEAIKTAGTIVVGTGGAAALWLAARRQQTSEIALRQKDKDQAHQERVAAHTEAVAAATQAHQERVALQSEHDAAERRVTDLYTKAVEQLGSEKAPVRLGGMYALERLAQNVPGQRQTIVNVLCAYLRMPYLPPALRSSTGNDAAAPAPPPSASQNVTAEPSGEMDQAEDERRHQERQVRLTAQRILAAHLRPGATPQDPVDTFWHDIDLDLTGATLVDLDMRNCSIQSAQFEGATFIGDTSFGGATFSRQAEFSGAIFSREAIFGDATFKWYALFRRTSFRGYTAFDNATFDGDALFNEARFSGDAVFCEAWFKRNVGFRNATFSEKAIFGDASFKEDPHFDGARVRLDLTLTHERTWPDGLAVIETSSDDEAQPLNQEGRWGYVRAATDGQSG